MFLPGDMRDRISDLRYAKHISMEELAKKVGISRSTLSRIESGRVKKIDSTIIKKFAETLEVSSDFILGLSNIPERQNYEITQLGLSEGAVRTLLSGKADIRVLNLLLENPQFADVTLQIRDYFDGTTEAGALNKNAVFDQNIQLLNEFKESHPEHADEVDRDIGRINREKAKPLEEDYIKITSGFMSAVKTTKEQMAEKKTPQAITSERLGLLIEQHLRDHNNGSVEGATAEQLVDALITALIEEHPYIPATVFHVLKKPVALFYKLTGQYTEAKPV